jgi:hypothetical protein
VSVSVRWFDQQTLHNKIGTHMKRMALISMILSTVIGMFAFVDAAYADKHGDRMKRDCATGARKC